MVAEGCGEGVVYLSCSLLWRRLLVSSILYPLLGFFGIWAIPGDVPFVLSVKNNNAFAALGLGSCSSSSLDCVSSLRTASKMSCFDQPSAPAALTGYLLGVLC
jgi:hypothetical protein